MNSSARGFTLVQLLLVIALAAIVLGCGREVLFHPSRAVVGAVAFSPDGRTLAAAIHYSTLERLLRDYLSGGTAFSKVKTRDMASGKTTTIVAATNDLVTALAFAPDGRSLAIGSRSGSVKLWDLRSQSERRRMTAPGRIEGVAFSPDGKWLAAAAYRLKPAVWDATTGEPIGDLEDQFHSSPCVAFSPDSRVLATGGASVNLWDLVTRRQLAMLRQSGVHSLAFSADGKTLAAVGAGEPLRVWSVHTGEERAAIPEVTPYSVAAALAYSPDGKTLAVGSGTGPIELWDWTTGKQLSTLSGHTAYVTGVAFSPDGKLLASSSSDGTARLWDVASAQQQAVVFRDDVDPSWLLLAAAGCIWVIAWVKVRRRANRVAGRLLGPLGPGNSHR